VTQEATLVAGPFFKKKKGDILLCAEEKTHVSLPIIFSAQGKQATQIKRMAKVLAHGIAGFSGSGAPTVLLTI
jgi:hypothetical protein